MDERACAQTQPSRTHPRVAFVGGGGFKNTASERYSVAAKRGPEAVLGTSPFVRPFNSESSRAPFKRPQSASYNHGAIPASYIPGIYDGVWGLAPPEVTQKQTDALMGQFMYDTRWASPQQQQQFHQFASDNIASGGIAYDCTPQRERCDMPLSEYADIHVKDASSRRRPGDPRYPDTLTPGHPDTRTPGCQPGCTETWRPGDPATRRPASSRMSTETWERLTCPSRCKEELRASRSLGESGDLLNRIRERLDRTQKHWQVNNPPAIYLHQNLRSDWSSNTSEPPY
jgi:hypothetical protein